MRVLWAFYMESIADQLALYVYYRNILEYFFYYGQ